MGKTESVPKLMGGYKPEMSSSSPESWLNHPVLVVVKVNISSMKRIVSVSKNSSDSIKRFSISMIPEYFIINVLLPSD